MCPSHLSDYTPYLEEDPFWEQLLARLPDDIEQSVHTCGAILRRRKVTAAAQLLRLIFAYACGLPLNVVAGWAAALGIAKVSDECLRTRIRDAATWLRTLLAQVLAARAGLTSRPELRLRLIDGTQVTRPGAIGSDFCLHLTFDLHRMRLDTVEVTDATQAEHLRRSAPHPGDLVCGDRAYGTRTSVLATVTAGAQALVRIAWNTFPLRKPSGEEFEIVPHLRAVPPGEIREWAVQMKPLHRTDPPVTGRFIASRLPAAEADKARDRTIKKQKKSAKTKAQGRKEQLQPETLEAAAYWLLFTTVPSTWATAAQIVALYRFRWQIELAIKRLKSIMGLAHLTARHTALCRAVLLAKLLLAVLVDDLCETAEAFSPFPRPRRATKTAAQCLGPLPAGLGNRPGLYFARGLLSDVDRSASRFSRFLYRCPPPPM